MIKWWLLTRYIPLETTSVFGTVKIIADSFKIGKIEWNPTARRKTPWLTGQRDTLNDIEKHNISLINYLEDRIPLKLINEIIKDGDNIPGGQDLTD